MLDTLLESRAARSRNSREALVSGAVHVGLIALATYFTTARAAATPAEERVTKIPFVSTAPVPAPSAATRSASIPKSAAIAAPRPISVSFNVPSEIPPVTLELGPVRNDDFPSPSRGVSTESSVPSQGSATEAYTAFDVETQVRAIAGSGFPHYPASLRAAGIEGQVVAQFIVNEQGRAIAESIRILSSANDLFSESVKEAVARMRFAPARIGGKTVRQTVQQQFVFKLDR